ncbi:hypothetical protein CO709_15265 [Burkholderia thailandensis]|nr:hypothetical protein CO709_15265 [Burkholderia thailandensis]
MGRLLYGPRATATDTFEQKGRTGAGVPARADLREASGHGRAAVDISARTPAPAFRRMRLALATRLILLL